MVGEIFWREKNHCDRISQLKMFASGGSVISARLDALQELDIKKQNLNPQKRAPFGANSGSGCGSLCPIRGWASAVKASQNWGGEPPGPPPQIFAPAARSYREIPKPKLFDWGGGRILGP